MSWQKLKCFACLEILTASVHYHNVIFNNSIRCCRICKVVHFSPFSFSWLRAPAFLHSYFILGKTTAILNHYYYYYVYNFQIKFHQGWMSYFGEWHTNFKSWNKTLKLSPLKHMMKAFADNTKDRKSSQKWFSTILAKFDKTKFGGISSKDGAFFLSFIQCPGKRLSSEGWNFSS